MLIRDFKVSELAMKELKRRLRLEPKLQPSTLVLGCLLEHVPATQRGDRNKTRAKVLTIRTSQPIRSLYLAARAQAEALTLNHDTKPVTQAEVVSWCLEQNLREARPMVPKPDIVAEFVDWTKWQHDIAPRSAGTAVSAIKAQGLLELNPEKVRDPNTSVEKWSRGLWLEFLAARLTATMKADTDGATPADTDTGLDL